MTTRTAWALLAALATTVPAARAAASPELSGGATGGYGLSLGDAGGGLHLGLRGDLLFLRERNRSGALGPYVELLTVGFERGLAGGGLTALVPGFETLAILPSAGFFGAAGDGGGVGAAAQVFVGLRGHNFHSLYTMQNGLFVEGRSTFADGRPQELLFGARVDLGVLALPFLLVWGAAH